MAGQSGGGRFIYGDLQIKILAAPFGKMMIHLFGKINGIGIHYRTTAGGLSIHFHRTVSADKGLVGIFRFDPGAECRIHSGKSRMDGIFIPISGISVYHVRKVQGDHGHPRIQCGINVLHGFQVIAVSAPPGAEVALKNLKQGIIHHVLEGPASHVQLPPGLLGKDRSRLKFPDGGDMSRPGESQPVPAADGSACFPQADRFGPGKMTAQRGGIGSGTTTAEQHPAAYIGQFPFKTVRQHPGGGGGNQKHFTDRIPRDHNNGIAQFVDRSRGDGVSGRDIRRQMDRHDKHLLISKTVQLKRATQYSFLPKMQMGALKKTESGTGMKKNGKFFIFAVAFPE